MAWIRIVTSAHYSTVFIRVNEKNRKIDKGRESEREILNIEIGNGNVYAYIGM